MHYKEVKSILSQRNGMNLYRGCTHGCIYCDSRSACYRFEHAFEDVEVKANAPELLEDALRRKRRPSMISTGSMSDPYLPIEKTEQLTRKCLEIIERHGFGISLLTKSDLVLRDIDLLARIAKNARAVVLTTLTTFDEKLRRVIEPNVCGTRARVDMLLAMRERGIETGVWLCPILPFINDTEENLLGLLDYCFEADARVVVNFGMGVTLRDGDRQYFYKKLDEHFPGMKRRYVQAFGNSYQCLSPNDKRLTEVFRRKCSERSVLYDWRECFQWLEEFKVGASYEQISMF